MGIRISDLPESLILADNDLFPIVNTDSNVTKYIEVGNVNLGYIKIGRPTSGSYAGGFLPLSASMYGSDVIKQLNESLLSFGSGSHQQNTDIGTIQTGFMLNLYGSSSVLLKNENGDLSVKDSSDSVYSDVSASNFYALNNVTAVNAGYFDSLHANMLVISSSITYSSGSTKFGDTLDDLHQFTGSVDITSSLTVHGILSSSYIYTPQLSSNAITTNLPAGNVLYVNAGGVLTSSLNLNYNGTDLSIMAGGLNAAYKSFKIPHPTQPDKTLVYGSLEGPEHGVYIRGVSESEILYLPEYWSLLVDEATITVQITPIGGWQRIFVTKIENNAVYLKQSVSSKLFGTITNTPFKYFYTINGERKDIPKLKSEI